jgi:hypothetical protein
MYTVNHRQRQHKVFLRFLIFVVPFLLALAALVWFFFFRDQNSSANFTKAGSEVAVVKPATKDFTNDYFKVSLPTSWTDLGRKNPFTNQIYYEFQNTQKDYDNRWLRIYVDAIPTDLALNMLLPLSVVNNKLVPAGDISQECRSFTGAPLPGAQSQAAAQTWKAKWQGVDFVCDMTSILNYVGTADADEGYGITLVNKNNTHHKYFFLYIDHNIRPDPSILVDAVKSFEVQ